MELRGHGLHVRLPDGWNGRIYERDGEATLHAANFVLPPDDADYATEALSTMGDHGILLVVTEFSPQSAGKGLFAHHQPARVHRADFDPQAMQRTIPGRAGVQRFFSAAGRAFCLFSVIATGTGSRHRVHHLNRVIETLSISTRTA